MTPVPYSADFCTHRLEFGASFDSRPQMSADSGLCGAGSDRPAANIDVDMGAIVSKASTLDVASGCTESSISTRVLCRPHLPPHNFIVCCRCMGGRLRESPTRSSSPGVAVPHPNTEEIRLRGCLRGVIGD